MEQPMHLWVPSIGISGAMFYTGDRFPQWKGNLFIAGMVGEQIGRLNIQGEKVVSRETILPGVGRIRDIRQGPDGYVYLVTEDREGKLPTPVYRLEPVERGSTR
jgi:glucose/arabinose dehydrogenase